MSNIYTLGDMHGRAEDSKKISKLWKVQENLNKKDVLICLGDFGYIWYHDKHPKFKGDQHFLKELSKKNYTFAFVDGNHENHDLINKSPIIEKWDGLVNEVYPGIFRLRRGEIYNINNKKIFTFGGAKSHKDQEKYNYDKKKKLKLQLSWWPQEIPSEKEFEYGLLNLEKHNYEVDYILSHTCPSSVIQKLYNETVDIDLERINDPVSIYFEEILQKTNFKEWHFGHHHKDICIEHLGKKFFCHYNEFPNKL